jgi:AbrB family looped-hinge helix DNA binding protein
MTRSLEVASVKIDAKGRILLPASLREELDFEPGTRVSLQKTTKVILVMAATRNGKGCSREAQYFSRLKRILDTPPERTGKPSNPSIEHMKKIWEPKV